MTPECPSSRKTQFDWPNTGFGSGDSGHVLSVLWVKGGGDYTLMWDLTMINSMGRLWDKQGKDVSTESSIPYDRVPRQPTCAESSRLSRDCEMMMDAVL